MHEALKEGGVSISLVLALRVKRDTFLVYSCLLLFSVIETYVCNKVLSNNLIKTQYFRLRLYDSDFNALSALSVLNCSLIAL